VFSFPDMVRFACLACWAAKGWCVWCSARLAPGLRLWLQSVQYACLIVCLKQGRKFPPALLQLVLMTLWLHALLLPHLQE